MPDPFALDQFVARRKLWTAFTPKFQVYDPLGNLVAYVEQKAFKLKEDITVFADEQKRQALLNIKARQVVDFSAAYDVVVPSTQEKVGALRRRGLKSILKDEWIILNSSDMEIGRIQEDSTLMAMLRRFITNLIPQRFWVRLGAETVGEIRQAFNLFVLQHRVDLSADPRRQFDRRLAIAAVVLLLAVEGRQQ